MKRFMCYYCDSEFDVHKDTVHNLIEHHESLTIKYRELELNEKTCRQGYWTKDYDIYPAECSVLICSKICNNDNE